MQRNIISTNYRKVFPLLRREYHKNVQKRFLATVKDVFPHKTDFPSRHIGPRKTEVVSMLDLLGYKVSFYHQFYIHLKQFHCVFLDFSVTR